MDDESAAQVDDVSSEESQPQEPIPHLRKTFMLEKPNFSNKLNNFALDSLKIGLVIMALVTVVVVGYFVFGSNPCIKDYQDK